MQSGDETARSAQDLLAGRFQGFLSTHSLEHEGYPFGSVVPYVLDREGTPLLLLSHLSQHTKNLEANPKCGLTVVQPGSGDVQQLSRLSAIGEVLQTDAAADAERYFNHFPQTRVYHDELGFRFYRFTPRRFHWNGGFASARWFDPGRILRTNPFGPEVEQQILDHMNGDHRIALKGYLQRSMDQDTDTIPTMAGIDGSGIDLRTGERLVRIALPRNVSTVEEARALLVEMAARGD
jgi:putative heme iron utilization protein